MKGCRVAARIRPLMFGEEVAVFSKAGPKQVQELRPESTYMYNFDWVF
jgi:hypothetical protein